MIRVLARIAPADVHLTRSQVNHHGIDGLLPVERIRPLGGMIANRIWQVYVVLLNGLQGLNGMAGALTQQTIGTEVTHAGGDQLLGLAFDFLHVR